MKIEDRIVSGNLTILDALKIMDSTGFRSLLVLDKYEKFKGILSIGDIQRSLIKNNRLDFHIIDILRTNPRVADISSSFTDIKNDMIRYRMEFMPVLNNNKEIVNIYFWEDIFEPNFQLPLTQFDVPVVIMAGGLGTRMKPLTNVIPKPLLPFGEKTILEDIFDRFSKHGCKRFYISVNYKADLIKYYVENLNLSYEPQFIQEGSPMGTAGSLSLLQGIIKETFFVSNCDILIDQDYSEILKFHSDNKNEITIVAALKSYQLPYGSIQTGDNGQLLRLEEKPEITFKINSGMYILEPHLIEEIPKDHFLHITDLIDTVKTRNGKIGVFPISEKSWKDMGNWNEFLQHIQ